MFITRVDVYEIVGQLITEKKKLNQKDKKIRPPENRWSFNLPQSINKGKRLSPSHREPNR
jgi:hypothetical protein